MPCRLTVIGAEREDVLRYLADPELLRWIDIRGRVSGESLWSELHEADVLCAPSLSGESFGMVLTEAFAAGTPVIASDIAGYSDVVTDGVDGLLVPPGDPQRLAEELQRAHHEPERLRGDGGGGPPQRPALRLAPRRRPGDRGLRAGDRGAAAGERGRAGRPLGRPATRRRRPAAARRSGCPRSTRRRPRRASAAARSPAGVGLGVAGALGIGLTVLAAQKIGVDNVVESIVRSNLTWVLDRLRADGALALLPRRLLVLDRPRGAAQPARCAAATSPRRR